MKRNLAFLAAVCLSAGIFFATSAMAQDLTPPPATDASGDTVRTNEPATPQAAPATDTTGTSATAARARRMRATGETQRTYILSLGIGSGILLKPESIKDNFNPSFGATLVVGARQHGVTAAVNFGYNFYMHDGLIPNDLNILTIFADLRYSPIHTKARPYLVICGGLWRQWIVDLDYTESVLGYGGGAGVEVEVDRVKRLFFDIRYIQGQTRETAVNPTQANTETLPMRLGVTWEFR